MHLACIACVSMICVMYCVQPCIDTRNWYSIGAESVRVSCASSVGSPEGLCAEFFMQVAYNNLCPIMVTVSLLDAS